jgi:integrase
MLRLSQTDGMTAKALHWIILTACRSGEALGARWDEVDMQAALWTVPEARMKAAREHRAPLSTQAQALLKDLPRFTPVEGDFIFPGRSGRELSGMSATMLLRRMKVDAVPHGFRSSFANWAAEKTSYSSDVREMALAHTLGDKTKEAYQRTDLLDLRRALMQDWADFCTSLMQKETG